METTINTTITTQQNESIEFLQLFSGELFTDENMTQTAIKTRNIMMPYNEELYLLQGLSLRSESEKQSFEKCRLHDQQCFDQQQFNNCFNKRSFRKQFGGRKSCRGQYHSYLPDWQHISTNPTIISANSIATIA
jgi:hypothetical protein